MFRGFSQSGRSALIVVVMGVAGSGKSTLARGLADTLHWPFQEGDELHPTQNMVKMSAGIALDDADRQPWLAAIEHWIDLQRGAGVSALVSCSALKQSYRQQLARNRPQVRVLYLRGSAGAIGARLAQRSGHFMPAKLLQSQFAALEEPAADERTWIIDIDGLQPDEVLRVALDRLCAGGAV